MQASLSRVQQLAASSLRRGALAVGLSGAPSLLAPTKADGVALAGAPHGIEQGITPPGAHSASVTRCFSSGAASGRIISSLVVERLPVILPEQPAWEVEYQEWQEKIFKKYKTLPKEFTTVERASSDGDSDSQGSWKPASRTTQADASGNVRTTWRQLDRRLYLLVRNKSTKKWEFPSIPHAEGETIRGTAERNLLNTAGTVKCFFVGNAPCGHYQNPAGDTQFFNKVQIMQRELELANTSGADDFVWVTSEEVLKYIDDAGLKDLTQAMLSP